MPLLDRKALALILIFTTIETIILTVWLALLGVDITKGIPVVAATVLFLGLLIEHTIATIAGKV